MTKLSMVDYMTLQISLDRLIEDYAKIASKWNLLEDAEQQIFWEKNITRLKGIKLKLDDMQKVIYKVHMKERSSGDIDGI